MARANTWLNADGLVVPFGTSDGKQSEAATIHTVGNYKEIRVNIDFSNLPTTGSAVQGNNIAIPEGAAIIASRYVPAVTFSHAVEIGTMDVDGVEVDKDGLHATSTLATGAVNTGAGAQIGDVVATVGGLYITVRPTTTTPTAGAGELIVTYSI